MFDEKITQKFNKPKCNLDKNAKRLQDQLEKKKSEFSFEIKEKWKVYPEIEDVKQAIDKSELTI